LKLPRDLEGRRLVAALVRHWGYRKVNQVGSHIILQSDGPIPHRLSVPDHNPLRVGTLNAILRSVSDAKGASRDAIIATLE
jgi:predicted RNA binding protein YcfA (HicA-like mRNA interferase family)